MTFNEFMEIGKYIAVFIAGLGAGWVINVKFNSIKNESDNKYTQKNNRVLGDQAGRDINK